jgi:ABC-type transport system involved in multi-copper enzyme maturation permease subunit
MSRIWKQSFGELNRLRKQPGPVVLALVWIVLLVSLFVLDGVWTWSDYGTTKNFKSIFSFPLNLRHWGQLQSAFSPYLCILLVVLALGGDFQLSVLKMSLPKYRRRSEYLVAKLIAMCVFLVGLNLISCALALLSGGIGSLVIHQPVRLADAFPFEVFGGLLMVAIFSMLLYGSITALTILLSRSSIAGLLAGIFVLPFLNLVTKISPKAAWFTPLHHLGNLEARLVYVGRLRFFVDEYGDHGVTASVLFLVAFVGMVFFFTDRRFRRMDFDANH